MDKRLFMAALHILHDHWVVPIQRRRFRTDLESILIQRYTLYCRERAETSPLCPPLQKRFRNQMIVGLNHPLFPRETLWFFRCPGCRLRSDSESDGGEGHGRRYIWSEIDKGSAFVCERCGHERFFFRRIYRRTTSPDSRLDRISG